MRRRRSRFLASAAALAAMLLPFVGSCAAFGERPTGTVRSVAESNAPIARVIQVLHREARIEGRLQRAEVAAALDAALKVWSGEALPLDALASIVSGATAVRVVEHTAGSPGLLTQVLAERVRLVVDESVPVRIVGPGAEDRQEPGIELHVLGGAWRRGRVSPAIGLQEIESGSAPLFVDLFDVRIDEQTWPADMLLIGEPGACMLALTTILTARATSRMPAADAMAERFGMDAKAIDWIRLAIAD